MSEFVPPTAQDIETLDLVRNRIVDFSDALLGKSIDLFRHVLQRNEIHIDDDEPLYRALAGLGGTREFTVKSHPILMPVQPAKLIETEEPIDRHYAATVTLTYSKVGNAGSDRLRTAFSGSERPPKPDLISVFAHVVGTGVASVDDQFGPTQLTESAICGVVPLYDRGYPFTYPSDSKEMDRLTRIGARFLDEDFLERKEDELLRFDRIFDAVCEALSDATLNPRTGK